MKKQPILSKTVTRQRIESIINSWYLYSAPNLHPPPPLQKAFLKIHEDLCQNPWSNFESKYVKFYAWENIFHDQKNWCKVFFVIVETKHHTLEYLSKVAFIKILRR